MSEIERPEAKVTPPAGRGWIVLLAFYFVGVSLAALYALLANSWFDNAPSSGEMSVTIKNDQLLLIVVTMGAIGSAIHGATSLSDYVGNRKFSTHWVLWFLFRPFIGVLLAVLFYFVLRVGFVNPNGQATEVVNPYAVAAFAGLVGMFSKQATDKLSEVFVILFRSRMDEQRGDKLSRAGTGPMAPIRPQIRALEPSIFRRGSGPRECRITGTDFGREPVVRVDGHLADASLDADGQIVIRLDTNGFPAAGQYEVVVVAHNGHGPESQPATLTVTD